VKPDKPCTAGNQQRHAIALCRSAGSESVYHIGTVDRYQRPTSSLDSSYNRIWWHEGEQANDHADCFKHRSPWLGRLLRAAHIEMVPQTAQNWQECTMAIPHSVARRLRELDRASRREAKLARKQERKAAQQVEVADQQLTVPADIPQFGPDMTADRARPDVRRPE
jgi:hypothetical protein